MITCGSIAQTTVDAFYSHNPIALMNPNGDLLLIDLAASSAAPDPETLKLWAADQRAFVSSVMRDYEEFRDAAVAAIEEVGAQPIVFERFGGRDADPEAAYLDEVASSHIYIGLMGARYGALLPSRYSATHAEYLRAEDEGLRMSMWVQTGIEREGPQQSFYEAVRTFDVYGSYASPDELRSGLVQRLRDIAAQDLAPWIKLGPLVFRAHEITESRDRVTVHATIRSAEIADAVQAMDDQFGRRDAMVTYPGRCLAARVETMKSTTRATRGREFEIELKTDAVSRPTMYTFNNITWEEMTALALRVSLFGESNPLGIGSHEAVVTNPLPRLAASNVAEESLRPIAELLLTETLATERGIQRITSLRLGRSVNGARRLKLSWLSPSQHTNQPPYEGTAEGNISM